MPDNHRVLHVAAEVQPLIKTGGLADVAGALPEALHTLGKDIRILMPGYGGTLERARATARLHTIVEWPGARLQETQLPGGCRIWLYETPAFRRRAGNPYDDPQGAPWPDNAERFDEFARVAAAIADDTLGLDWRPEIVHAHDWHTGLVPVHMQLARAPAATVFTIHNLAYQGLFPLATRDALGLPGWLDHWEALEFDGRMSLIKGGIGFADRLTTVSGTYAREITTPAFGAGLEGLLASRGTDLVGIANGIDTHQWNPARDPALPTPYDADQPAGKREARGALLRETGLQADETMPVIAYIGRLAEQKGVDLLVEALARIIARPAVVIVLGSGDPVLRDALRRASGARPDRVFTRFDFDEAFAHRIYGGADMLLMPSRFEPCGLSQLNAMRYGTIPIVRRTGGLAETVVDTDRTTLADGIATGFQFDGDDADSLAAAVRRACDCFAEPATWAALIDHAMRRDSGWARSARAYRALYRDTLNARHRHLPPLSGGA
ncbi:MAG: glycogen synthase GlgA [Halofilum sp. (in: g-proteobacteria)]